MFFFHCNKLNLKLTRNSSTFLQSLTRHYIQRMKLESSTEYCQKFPKYEFQEEADFRRNKKSKVVTDLGAENTAEICVFIFSASLKACGETKKRKSNSAIKLPKVLGSNHGKKRWRVNFKIINR